MIFKSHEIVVTRSALFLIKSLEQADNLVIEQNMITSQRPLHDYGQVLMQYIILRESRCESETDDETLDDIIDQHYITT